MRPLDIQKPREGEPCNGCGFCCREETCLVGQMYLGAPEDGPCPALEVDGDRYACGLVLHHSHYLPTPPEADGWLGQGLAEALGCGRGCDSEDPQ